MKLLSLSALTIFAIFSIAVPVCAEESVFKQQILPIDCLYEVVDVGTQKLRYLTPDTCPIDPGPPIITEPMGGTVTVGPEVAAMSLIKIPPTRGNSIITSGDAPAQTAKKQELKLQKQVAGSMRLLRDEITSNMDSILLTMALLLVIIMGLFARWRYPVDKK